MSAILDKLLKGQKVEWETIGDLGILNRGKRLVRSQLGETGTYPVYQNSLTPLGYFDDKNTLPNTTFIIAAGAAGEIGHSKSEFWAADDCYFFKVPREKLNDKFIYYFLLTQKSKIVSQVRKASVPRLGRNSVENIAIPIPPLDVQAEIVRILDAFTAITAELTAELNMREKQYQYYHDKLLDFSHRDIEWTTLDKVSLVIDSLHQTPKYSENGLNMIRVTDIKSGLIDLSKTLKVDQETFKIFTKKYLPKKFDLVISRVGSYGNVAVVPEDNVVCMGQNTVVINPLINSIFLYHILTSKNTKLFIEKNVGGGNQKTLSLKSIKEIPIPSIDFKEQGYIANILSKFETLTHSITQGLPKEITLRKQQYEYYREQLLDFAKN